MSLALVDVHGFSLETAIESEISELENGIFFEMVIESAKLSVIEMAAPSAKRNGQKLQVKASIKIRYKAVLHSSLKSFNHENSSPPSKCDNLNCIVAKRTVCRRKFRTS